MDVVYVVADQPDHEDLRYSLRSLRNLDHDQVWIVGDLPDWATAVGHIPTEQSGTVWRNSTDNMLAACRHPDISERFVWMHDDFFVLEPTGEVPILHRGPITDRYPRAPGPTPRGARRYDAMEGTYKLIAEAMGTDHVPLDYELHVPLPVDRLRMLEAIEWARAKDPLVDQLRKRSLYANLHRIGGDYSDDVTSRERDATWADGQRFVSTSDVSFAEWPIGERLRRLFADPSPYEKETP